MSLLHRFCRCRSSAVLVVLLLTACAWGPVCRTAHRLADEHRAGQPFSHVTQARPDLTLDDAYRIQHAFVRARYGTASVAGYKGGLTARPAWEKFGLDAPAVGVLPADARLAVEEGRYRVNRADYGQVMLETELAFRFRCALAKPVTDIAALRDCVDGVAPALEVPDLGFADRSRLNGRDLIAVNVSARGFALGDWRAPATVDPNSVRVTLIRDGVPIHTGRGTDAMGGQWQALHTLVNELLARGYRIAPGQWLMTGALGGLAAGEPGVYQADFGALGTLALMVE